MSNTPKAFLSVQLQQEAEFNSQKGTRLKWNLVTVDGKESIIPIKSCVNHSVLSL